MKILYFNNQIENSLSDEHYVLYHINQIHEYDHTSKPHFTLFRYFLRNSLTYMNHTIDVILKESLDKRNEERIIDIHKKFHSIQSEHIEDATKIIKPLCGIIAQYLGDWFKDSYVIKQGNDTVKIYLSVETTLRTCGGMGATSY